jgi:hypothetical protein
VGGGEGDLCLGFAYAAHFLVCKRFLVSSYGESQSY